MYTASAAVRRYREALLAQPWRPGYHFAVPDGNGMPGDPNGAFFADGRCHLMYLYRNDETNGYHWGHVSSVDLLHWRHHPDALTVQDGDSGCFSGGGFVDDDGRAYLTFWKFPAKNEGGDRGGIALAVSEPPYDVWERMEPLALESSAERWGVTELNGRYIGSADPSNIWKKDGFYYLQTGNKCVLTTVGAQDPAYTGDWTDLLRSRDLKTWEYRGRFYVNSHAGEDWPDETEDDMCPSFLPLPDAPEDGRLTDKWLQLFISHNKGAQYYTGTLAGERFLPETHGRFSWRDNTCFAPEALLDDRNRQIAWHWLLGSARQDYPRFGWTGVLSLPRLLWYDGGLRMAPVPELARLACNPQTFQVGKPAGKASLSVKNGVSCRIKAGIRLQNASFAAFRVLSDGEAYTEIGLDLARGLLYVDSTRGSAEGRPAREEAPFVPAHDSVTLDIFVDRCVVEVFADDRQAVTRQVFPARPAAMTGVEAVSDGADFGTVRAWEMMPSNPY